MPLLFVIQSVFISFASLPSRGTADWFGVSKDGDSTQRWRRKSLQHCGQLYGGLKAQVVREMELRSQDNLSLASTETPPPLYLPPLHPSQQHCGIQRVGLPRRGPGLRRLREKPSPGPEAPSHCSGTFLPPLSLVSPSRSVAFAQADAGGETQSASRLSQVD